MLTRRPGTTITFFGTLPATAASTLASASAAASTSAGEASAATVRWPRTLPLTWTGYSTTSSTRRAGSATGNGSKASDWGWPNRAQSSSATCGVTGAIISTSGSATSRETWLPDTLVRWLFSSISLAIAVLKRSPS